MNDVNLSMRRLVCRRCEVKCLKIPIGALWSPVKKIGITFVVNVLTPRSTLNGGTGGCAKRANRNARSIAMTYVLVLRYANLIVLVTRRMSLDILTGPTKV